MAIFGKCPRCKTTLVSGGRCGNTDCKCFGKTPDQCRAIEENRSAPVANAIEKRLGE